ncbi:MAG: glycosyltransferase family 39 protein [Phycisphaerae bacterium]
MRVKAFVVLLILAFSIRIGICSYRGGLGRTPDSYREYVMVADRLLQHGTVTCAFVLDEASSAPSAVMPPAYALLVAAAYAVLGAESFAATLLLQIINALATTAAVAVVFVVARQLGGGRAGWVAAIIAALNPAIAGFTPLIWDTSLFTLGVALTVWMVVRLSHGPPDGKRWLAFGLWLGGLALLNPALTIAYPFLVLWSLTRSQNHRPRATIHGVGLTVVGWLVVITPWTIRNFVHFDRFMYIRSGLKMELWLGVCPEADQDPGAIFNERYPLKNAEAQRRVVSMGEEAFLDESGRQAIEAIRADPWRFVRLTATRLLDYWTGTVFTHVHPGEGGWPKATWRAALAVVLSAEIAGLVFLLLVPLVKAGRSVTPEVYWLLAIVASFSLVYCLTHVQVRYRAPCEPLIAIVLALLACPGSFLSKGTEPS